MKSRLLISYESDSLTRLTIELTYIDVGQSPLQFSFQGPDTSVAAKIEIHN